MFLSKIPDISFPDISFRHQIFVFFFHWKSLFSGWEEFPQSNVVEDKNVRFVIIWLKDYLLIMGIIIN